MKYWVTYKIEARYTAKVDADSIEEAIDKSRDEWYDADFGEAEDIDGEPIIVETDRELVWEK